MAEESGSRDVGDEAETAAYGARIERLQQGAFIVKETSKRM